MRKRKNNMMNAASSVLETILLLGMTVGFFSILYLSIFTFSSAPLSPTVHILGTTSENTIILYHRGGGSLPLDSTIYLTVSGTRTNYTINEYLDNAAKQDFQWNMGEQIIIPYVNLSSSKVEVVIIDGESKGMVLHAFL